MDNPATLLTAIMFVTVLGMAIGNLLMACADIAGGLRKPTPERLHMSWIILLLIALLNLFWETTAVLDVEDWLFLDFLYVICGPMFLLFAVGVITAPSAGDADGEHGLYFGLCRRFFVMLALQQVWLIGLDFRYDMVSTITTIGALLVILFLALAVTRNYQAHIVGNVLGWIGLLLPIGIQVAA